MIQSEVSREDREHVVHEMWLDLSKVASEEKGLSRFFSWLCVYVCWISSKALCSGAAYRSGALTNNLCLSLIFISLLRRNHYSHYTVAEAQTGSSMRHGASS